MDTVLQLQHLIDETLNLGGRAATFTASTPLAGAQPEFDSMGVVALIGALEERFGISVQDHEIDGTVFETFGSLCAFLNKKLAA